MNKTKMDRNSIDFYFDFLSPYSYLAFKLLEKKKYFSELNCEWNFLPVTLGSVISHYETKGPGEITPKRNYLFKDINRKMAKEKIAFLRPIKLPFNSLFALRLALKEVAGPYQLEMIEILFDFAWGRGADLSDVDFLEKVLKENFETQDVRSMLELEGSREARLSLKNNIKKAFEIGVFGVPSFYVNDSELFWGADSLEFLEDYLKGNLGYDKKIVDEFEAGFPFL